MTSSSQNPVLPPNGESHDLPFLAPHMFDPRSGLELGERGLQWSAFAGKRGSGLLTAMHKRWGMSQSKLQQLASRYEAFGIDGAGAWLEINPKGIDPQRLGGLMKDPQYSVVQSLRLGAIQDDGEYAFAYDTAWFHDSDEFLEFDDPNSGTKPLLPQECQWLNLVAHHPGDSPHPGTPVGVLGFNVRAHHNAQATRLYVDLSDIFVVPEHRGRGGYGRALAMGCAYVLSELLLIAHTVSAPGREIEMTLLCEPIEEAGEHIADMIYREVLAATDLIRIQRHEDDDIGLDVYLDIGLTDFMAHL